MSVCAHASLCPCQFVPMLVCAHVSHVDLQVDLQKKTCCAYVIEYRMPCRHMACVFYKEKMLGNTEEQTLSTLRQFWPGWAQNQTYLAGYSSKRPRRPQTFYGEWVGDPADVILPPPQRKTRGRPRKKRFKKRKRTPAVIAKEMRARGRWMIAPELAALTMWF